MRPVAVPDLQIIRRGNRALQVLMRFFHCDWQGKAFGQARRNRMTTGYSRCHGCFWSACAARSSSSCVPLIVSSGNRGRCHHLHDHPSSAPLVRTQRTQRLPLRHNHVSLINRHLADPEAAAASGRFGVITVARGTSTSRRVDHRLLGQQHCRRISPPSPCRAPPDR